MEDVEAVRDVLERMGSYLQSSLEDSDLKLKYSGTTLVVALIIKNYLYFMNIGDSRAILASKINDNISESFSTIDHNPDIPEERERIEKKNGLVAQYIDEEEGPCGPQRVWDQTMRSPGLAMSRSLGDKYAHTLGVSEKPGKLKFLN